jgi:hypothetical protein
MCSVVYDGVGKKGGRWKGIAQLDQGC